MDVIIVGLLWSKNIVASGFTSAINTIFNLSNDDIQETSLRENQDSNGQEDNVQAGKFFHGLGSLFGGSSLVRG